MPPGTGDIQITLCQSVGFTGAVVVTTPHILALRDVLKGVAMFNKLKVPVLAVVSDGHQTSSPKVEYKHECVVILCCSGWLDV